MVVFCVIFIIFLAYVTLKSRIFRQHEADMLAKFNHRVHVNGIRGKSSVTRLISAALREGNIKTVGKTTGTAARILVSHNEDVVIDRKEADIAEQKRVLDLHKHSDYRAVVFECMAINPIYQKYLEEKIMKSTIGVITNVREDHMDQLGKTLPQIARSLSATIPRNGHLVTAESDPELLAIFQEECNNRGSVLHPVSGVRVSDRSMAKFNHFEYKENVAIALEVAELCGVSRSVAFSGMYKALPDPGAFVLKDMKHDNKKIYWANLFAINDRESFVMTADVLSNKVGASPKKAVILNNRHDRPERVAQFVDIAVNSVHADYIITFGDYEKRVGKEMKKYRDSAKVQLIQLGNSSAYKDATGTELLNKITEEISEPEFLLFGAVNIHTKQATSLLSLLETQYAH